MRIAALTSGINEPSSRFRIRQYLPDLRAQGIDVTEYCPIINQGARLPGKLGRIRMRYLPPLIVGQMIANLAFRIPGMIGSRSADVTWLERNFVPGLDQCARLLKRPLVIDMDDAIWLYGPLGSYSIKRLVKQADMVFAGNQFLAEWCADHCNNVQIVPTAIDVEKFQNIVPAKRGLGKLSVGWTGTSSNFRYLRMIEPALATYFRSNPLSDLVVIADRDPKLQSIPPGQFNFIKWSAENEHAALRQLDVGIMPIDNSDLAKGKCSFKMLQYMACGIPVIASPFGMNAKIFREGKIGIAAEAFNDWVDGLNFYNKNYDDRIKDGEAGRQLINSSYSTKVVSRMIAKLFQNNFY